MGTERLARGFERIAEGLGIVAIAMFFTWAMLVLAVDFFDVESEWFAENHFLHLGRDGHVD